jgi:cyclase
MQTTKLFPHGGIVALVAVVTVALSSHADAQDFDAVEVTVHEVAGNVRYLEGAGGNIGLLTGDDGVVLIDDQYAPLTGKIVDAIRTVSDGPIRFVINTHMHPDHTGGNENFGEMGAVIVGHDNVRTQMAAAGYEETPPFVTFSKDMTFNLNGETIHVFKIPDAHTNGDSYIKFENANVIHTGDVFRTTSYPYIDAGNGGSFLGTLRAHDLLLDIADVDTRILPGHGTVSDIQTVRETRDMLLTVRNRVQQAINDGLSLEETQAAGLTEEFDPRWQPSRPFATAEQLIAVAYAELSAD